MVSPTTSIGEAPLLTNVLQTGHNT